MDLVKEFESLIKQGNQEFEKKEFNKAEDFYLQALELNDNDPRALMMQLKLK
jgi:hypothetical protein